MSVWGKLRCHSAMLTLKISVSYSWVHWLLLPRTVQFPLNNFVASVLAAKLKQQATQPHRCETMLAVRTACTRYSRTPHSWERFLYKFKTYYHWFTNHSLYHCFAVSHASMHTDSFICPRPLPLFLSAFDLIKVIFLFWFTEFEYGSVKWFFLADVVWLPL